MLHNFMKIQRGGGTYNPRFDFHNTQYTNRKKLMTKLVKWLIQVCVQVKSH